jgi:lycopene beta-cyclase
MHFIHFGKFTGKKILLIDKSPKTANDRTWCFWETKPGLFEPVVKKQWSKVLFKSGGFSRVMDIEPYRYKMIRGIDFYEFCFSEIREHQNIEVMYAAVEAIDYNETCVVANGRRFYAQYIFNSILFGKPAGQFYLLQHFKGWLVETPQPVFDEHCATLMDFSVPQRHGTTFTYVLPVSSTVAMIEYTLFTKDLLRDEEYDQGLKDYIKFPYKILDEEKGVIPMTNYSFPQSNGNVINIGSAGGQTKPSSGYTFYFIQQHSRAITDEIIKTGKPFTGPLYSKKFNYYDSVLLNVLATNKLPGKQVFTELFKRNKPSHILQFLNNESSISTDLRIISSLPTLPFLHAGLQQLK